MGTLKGVQGSTPNLPTNTCGVDFRGFDSSTILRLRGEVPRPIGDLPESLSQAMSVGTMLVGRLGVARDTARRGPFRRPFWVFITGGVQSEGGAVDWGSII